MTHPRARRALAGSTSSGSPVVLGYVGPRRRRKQASFTHGWRWNSHRFAISLGVVVAAGLAASQLCAVASAVGDVERRFLLPLRRQRARSGHFYVYGNPVPTAFHPPAWPAVLSLYLSSGSPRRSSTSSSRALSAPRRSRSSGSQAAPSPVRAVGLIAAAIGAVYPNFFIWERELASETLVLPLVAGTVLMAYRFRARPRLSTMIALGTLCALLTLTRAEQVLLFACLLVPLALRCPGLPLRPAAIWLVAAAVAAGLISAPWIVFNASRFEHPVVLTTSFGPALRISNDAVTYRGTLLGSADNVYWRQWSRQTGDESVKDLSARREALTYVRSHLAHVPIVVSGSRGTHLEHLQRRTTGVARSELGARPLGVYRVAVVTYWLLLATAIVGIVVLRRRGIFLLPLLAPFLVVAVAAAVTFGEPRYRAAAEVPLVLLAAVGIDALIATLLHPRTGQCTASLDTAD